MKRLFNYFTFSLVLIVSVFVFAGCTSDDEVAKLQQRLDEMQQSYDGVIKDLQNENNDLLDKITELENKFIDNEETDNKQNQNIDAIQSFITSSNTKVYSLGEAVSYSCNGIKLLEVANQTADWTSDALVMFLKIEFYKNIDLFNLLSSFVFTAKDGKIYTPLNRGFSKERNNYYFGFAAEMPKNSNYYLFLTIGGTPFAVYYF